MSLSRQTRSSSEKLPESKPSKSNKTPQHHPAMWGNRKAFYRRRVPSEGLRRPGKCMCVRPSLVGMLRPVKLQEYSITLITRHMYPTLIIRSTPPEIKHQFSNSARLVVARLCPRNIWYTKKRFLEKYTSRPIVVSNDIV